MDKNQIVAISGAFLIASAGVAGVRAWANASARAVMESPAASVGVIQTLPTITVRPTREQLQTLHPQASHESSSSSLLGGGGFAMDMPYYSFGAAIRASKG
ncbi:MAG TPA: hypothetical protein VFP88_00905 [Rhodanobacteraceae bacterium]|nr:hypothetical protein [Rhodanobacteraceae bacterium]